MVNSFIHNSQKERGNSFCLIISLLIASVFVLGATLPLVSGQFEPGVEPDNWYSMRANSLSTGTSMTPAPNTDELYWVIEPEANPNFPLGMYGSVAIVDHVVYAGHLNGHLYAIEEASGKILWDFEATHFSESFGPFPFASSAAVDPGRGMVYIATDGLYAVDMYDGTLVWKTDTGFADAGYVWEFWSSPNFDDEAIYFSSVSEFLHKIDPVDGSILWSCQTGERQYSPGTSNELTNWGGGPATSTPAIGPNLVYFMDWDENLYGVDKSSGELMLIQGLEHDPSGLGVPMEWGPFDTGGGQGYPSIALDEGANMLYAADTAGWVYGMSMDPDNDGIDQDGDGNPNNEADIIWDYQTGNDVLASPSVHDGTVYVGSTDGDLYAFNGASGGIEWQTTLNGFPIGSQAVADGKVFTTTAANEGGWVGYVSAYDLSDGQEIWSMRVPNPFVAGPVPYNDKVVVGDFFDPNHLIAFGADGPKPDLFVADLSVSEENDDGERIIYTTIGNKANTVRSSPYNVTISVDGAKEYEETFGALDSGEIRPASVRLEVGSGKHDIKVELTGYAYAWNHIPETNTGNNDMETTVGGIVNAIKGESSFAFPLWFLLGLLIGFALAYYFLSDEDRDGAIRQPAAHVREVPPAGGADLQDDLGEGMFITSAKAKRYHRSRCPFAMNIPHKGGHIVTQKEAEKQGKKPCQCTEIKSEKDTEESVVLDAEQ